MDNEIQEGIDILESIWFLTAVKLVELAIHTYRLNEEQAAALKDVFLKQNNYYIQLI